MKKLVSMLIVLAMVLSIGMIAGAESAPVEITFWHAMGGVNGEALTTMIEQFNTEYEGKIHVNYEYQGSYDDAFSKIQAAGSDIPCDLMQVYDIGTRYMIDMGWAKPMQEFIDAEGYDISVLEGNVLAYYTVDGTLYSMPFNSSTPILYYNKTAFAEAGLDPEQPPKNFDEIFEFAQKLRIEDENGNVVRYGFGMGNYGWFFEQWVGKMGLHYVDNNNGRGQEPATKVEFDTNGAGAAILSVWQKAIGEGIAPYLNQGNDDAKQAFINGSIAITLESTAALKTLLTNVGDSFELGCGYFPYINADDAGGVSIGGGSLWAFETGDETREAATWEFVKFLISPEQQAFWNAQTGYFPINTLAQETETFKANIEQYPQFQVALDQLHDSAPEYAGALLAVFSTSRASVQSYTEKLVNGEIATVDEAVTALAAEINESIELYNLTNG